LPDFRATACANRAPGRARRRDKRERAPIHPRGDRKTVENRPKSESAVLWQARNTGPACRLTANEIRCRLRAV
jgi:hypothetical protein